MLNTIPSLPTILTLLYLRFTSDRLFQSAACTSWNHASSADLIAVQSLLPRRDSTKRRRVLRAIIRTSETLGLVPYYHSAQNGHNWSRPDSRGRLFQVAFLKSNGLPIISYVACAQPLVSLRINGDTLAVTPIRRPLAGFIDAELDLVAHFPEHLYCIRREPLFNARYIRQRLVVKAGSVHCLLNVHAVINHAHQNICHGCDDAWTAGRAKDQERLAIFQHYRWRHGGKRALARTDCVCRPLDQTIDVRN